MVESASSHPSSGRSPEDAEAAAAGTDLDPPVENAPGHYSRRSVLKGAVAGTALFSAGSLAGPLDRPAAAQATAATTPASSSAMNTAWVASYSSAAATNSVLQPSLTGPITLQQVLASGAKATVSSALPAVPIRGPNNTLVLGWPKENGGTFTPTLHLITADGRATDLSGAAVTVDAAESYGACLTPAAAPGSTVVGLVQYVVGGSKRGPRGLVPFERSGTVQTTVDFFDVASKAHLGQFALPAITGVGFNGYQLYAGYQATSFYLFQRNFHPEPAAFENLLTVFNVSGGRVTGSSTLAGTRFGDLYPGSYVPPGSLFQLPGELFFAAGPMHVRFGVSQASFSAAPQTVPIPSTTRPRRIVHAFSQATDRVVFAQPATGSLAAVSSTSGAPTGTGSLPAPSAASALAQAEPAPVHAMATAVSPDGQTLAVAEGRAGATGVWLISLPGLSGARQVLTGQPISSVAWFSDDSALWAFSARKQLLFIVAPDGTVAHEGVNCDFWCRYFVNAFYPNATWSNNEGGALVGNAISHVMPIDTTGNLAPCGGSTTCNTTLQGMADGNSMDQTIQYKVQTAGGYLTYASRELMVFIDIEGSEMISEDYWSGWAYGVEVQNVNPSITFHPCAYTGSYGPGNANARTNGSKIAQAGGCFGTWANEPNSQYNEPGHVTWGQPQPHPYGPLGLAVRFWQFNLGTGNGKILENNSYYNVDVNLSNPYETGPGGQGTSLLDYLLLIL